MFSLSLSVCTRSPPTIRRTHFSIGIGIETTGGVFTKIINRNSPIPTKKQQSASRLSLAFHSLR